MRITLYLLREEAEFDRSTLRNSSSYTPWAVRAPDEDDLDWQLFVRQAPSSPPKWMPALAPIIADSDATERQLLTRSAGAVLLARTSGRVFVLTFGTGYHAVDESQMEPDFGLIVAANSVDPRKLKVAEARGMDKGMRNAVSSLPVPNEIFALGLSTNEEWIKRLGGKVSDETFAASISGADSLRLSIEDFSLDQLGAKLKQVLTVFQRDSYKQVFPFLNYFRRLPAKDPLIAELDAQLLSDMTSRSEQVGFAAPDEFEFATPDFYMLRRRGRRKEVEVGELSSEAVYDALDQLGAWDDPLRGVDVAAFGGADHIDDERMPLDRYTVVNVRRQVDGVEDRFARTAGAWFRIDRDYVETLERFMAGVQDITPDFPLPVWDEDWLVANNIEGKYGEERYNNHVGKECGYAVLDRKFYRGRAGQKIEVCDLLTPARQLVCVKRLDGADRLSHLFQQGSVSSRLMQDVAYQTKVLDALDSVGGGHDFGDRSGWTFVFAIATSRTGALHDILTFFGRVALMTHAEAIAELGYKVAIAKVDYVAATKPPPSDQTDD
ncbi:DUF6119 family protein [Fodinicola acaciae]|uniref:DUF6119 family protein n=1 Tax=Fodinicola acaciae TaxID=2681555 RepID=UPI0013D17343|nr:DUF6119 family protein [Fodinicola acaciae]